MKLYCESDCEKWVGYKRPHSMGNRYLMFSPEIENEAIPEWQLADIGGKSFQHNEARIYFNINKILETYPKLKSILNSLNVLLCPKPFADISNSFACGNSICYSAKSTQIPFCMTDYITPHEIGHVVQYNLCKERNDCFREYLKLRNLELGLCKLDIYDSDDKITTEFKEDFLYCNGSYNQKKKYWDWDMRPTEWFAEDFRYLFGYNQGDYWGLSIDKPNANIKDFMLAL